MGLPEIQTALKAKFTNLSADDFKSTAGDRPALAKLVAEKEGKSEDEAKKEIDEIFEQHK